MKKIFTCFLLITFTLNISFSYNKIDYLRKLSVSEQHRIEIIESILPSVVNIVWYIKVYKRIYKYIDLWDGFIVKVPRGFIQAGYKPVSAWTAFFISSNGILLTNYHVVADSSLKYKAIDFNWKEHDVKILLVNKKLDLALLYVKWKHFKSVKLWNSDYVMLWQTVFAIGNTLWEYPYTVSDWIISGKWRSIVAWWIFWEEYLEWLLQTTAPINPWNSWWPLVDSLWNVIWINVAINSYGQNIWFAIPINEAIQWLKNIK